MPTPNTTASLGDIDAISLLQESELTAQQIADAILKSKNSTRTISTDTEIDAAVIKVGLIQDVSSVISGLTATGAEISGLITATKKGFNPLQPNSTRGNMVAYTSSGALMLTAKMGAQTDINMNISKRGVNNVTTIYAVNTQANSNSMPDTPAAGTWSDIFRATTDNVCAPYRVKALANGDSGISNFTGGWHGQSGSLVGLPTAEFVGYTFVVDGVDRTIENNVVRSGVKKVEYTVTHNIMGYNTFTSSRYVLQEEMKYTIIDGIIEFDMKITALEDCQIETYYGLQTQANSVAWNQTALFKNGEFSRLNFIADINSGNKYSGISTLTSQKGTYELETWIDNTYGLGQRKQVLDSLPSVFGISSTMKVYQNLVNGIPLILLAGQKAYWRGGWRVRNIDSNRL